MILPLLGLVVCSLALAACGGSERVSAPLPADRSAVPVVVYRGVPAEAFARHMALLDAAGYDTITLAELLRFLRRQEVALPPRPLVLTFDGGRRATRTTADATLRELGWEAALFVDAGRVAAGHREYLTWDELDALQRSGRWDVQLQSGEGHHLIRWGPGRDDVGPFYAYRGEQEVLGGWRERVFSDITWAEEQLAFRVEGYRPLAFAPPYGNYGQIATNDPRIPRELLRRLFLSFEIVFTQDRSGFARPGAHRSRPLGRIEITPDVSESELQALLTVRRPRRGKNREPWAR